MKYPIVYLFASLILMNCTNFSKEELNDFLVGESFLLVSSKQDRIEVEFLENCIRSYPFNSFLSPDWVIQENIFGVQMSIGSDLFHLQFIDEEKAVFKIEDDLYTFTKINQDDNQYEFEALQGKWIEALSYSIYFDTNQSYRESLPPPAPCFFDSKIDSFLIPGIEFFDDFAIQNDYCHKRTMSLQITKQFGFITFGNGCYHDQWKIQRLTKDSLVVNRMYKDRKITNSNSILYDENYVYIKKNY